MTITQNLTSDPPGMVTNCPDMVENRTPPLCLRTCNNDVICQVEHYRVVYRHIKQHDLGRALPALFPSSPRKCELYLAQRAVAGIQGATKGDIPHSLAESRTSSSLGARCQGLQGSPCLLPPRSSSSTLPGAPLLHPSPLQPHSSQGQK